MVTGLLFGVKKDDFDFIISGDEKGCPIVYECYPDAFVLAYKDKSCSVYELAEEGFMRGMTGWSLELVCEKEVVVQNEEEHGNIVIHRYVQDMEYKARIARHITDRLLRFDIDLSHCMEQDTRFRDYYGELVKALGSVTDGHLLL